MKRRIVILAPLVLLLAAAAAYYRYVPGHTPAGQPALENLDPGSFERQFKAAAAETRLLVLLSPT